MIKFEVDRNLKTFQLLEVSTKLAKIKIEIDFKKPIGNIKHIILEVKEDLVWLIYTHKKLGQIATRFQIDEMVSLDLVFYGIITVIDRCCFLSNIISLCFVTSKPKVTFKVKSLENDLYEILELDYDDTTTLDIKRNGYHFKLTNLGLEIASTSSTAKATSVIMKNRNLVPLLEVLKHKIVTEPSELRRFITILNTSQSDVMFVIKEEEINTNETI